MKKYVTLICLSLSLILIVDTLGVFDALLMFLITGSLPLMDIDVPPLGMMAFIGLVFIGLVTRGYTQLLDKLSQTKHQLPSRRFRNI